MNRLGKYLFSTLFLTLTLIYSGKPVLAITQNFYSENLTNNIVYNPFQGLGICHWSSPAILDDPIVSWSYDSTAAIFWKTIEPIEGQFNWSSIDNLIARHQSKGKKLWLQLYNANADAIPDWAKTKVFPDGKKIQFMGQDYSTSPNPPCTVTDQGLPLPWDENYLASWRNVINALAARYDSNPTVEAIVTMAGGGYGEMVICSNCGPAACWAKYAGCPNWQSCKTYGSGCDASCMNIFDTKFVQSVEGLIDLYLNAFQNKPIVLQLGNGLNFLNHSTTTVIKPVLDYAIPKYGMRVLTKSNGWHCGQSYCLKPNTPCEWGQSGVINYFLDGSRTDRTKYGLEPGWPTDNPEEENGMIGCRPYASYACLQDRYWSGNNGNNLQNFSNLRTSLARSLGAKVALKDVTYPEQIPAGQPVTISATFKNLGTIPPFRPQRVDIKDLAASYQVSFQLIKNEQIIYQAEVIPNPATEKWTNNQEVTVSRSFTLPTNFILGNYELRVGIWDPEAAIRTRQEYFRVLNNNLLDTLGRAKIGQITVTGAPPDCTDKDIGDILCDGIIDLADARLFLEYWQVANLEADFSHDNQVNETDLTILLSNWGR